MSTPDLIIPEILRKNDTKRAVKAVNEYFAEEPFFTGSHFERLAGGGDRGDSANKFTSDDLTAVSMLSVTIPPRAALRILGEIEPEYQQELSSLLKQLPTNVDLWEATDSHLETANKLWRALITNHKVGAAKTSKLLARKRPRMLPIIDSVVRKELRPVKGQDFYKSLRHHLNADDQALVRTLKDIREKSDRCSDISVIRIFDIIVWQSGKGNV